MEFNKANSVFNFFLGLLARTDLSTFLILYIKKQNFKPKILFFPSALKVLVFFKVLL